MARDLLIQLEEYGHQLDADATPLSFIPSVTVTQPPKPRTRPWMVLIGAAVITFVLIGALTWFVGGSTIPPANITDTPAPTPDIGTGWTHLNPEKGGALAAATDLGFVVAGYTAQGPDGGPTVWHSPDGESWSPATGIDYTPNLYIADVTAGGPGFVAVGNMTKASSYSARIWTSSDGQNWHEVTAPLPSGNCAGLGSVEANERVVVAFGCDRSGQFATFSSTNGEKWIVAPLPVDTAVVAAAGGESGFLVLSGPEVAAFSSNGTDWETFGVDTPPDGNGGTPAVGANGLLLQAGEVDGTPMVWLSTDRGRTWERTSMVLEDTFPIGDAVTMHDLIASPFGFIGVGMLGEMDEAFEENPEEAVGFILHSWDGLNWRAVSLDGAPPFTELVTTDDMLVGTFAGYGSWMWTPVAATGTP